MMKVEFERLVGEQISDADWELVELVYNLHPRDFSKEEVATLWKIGGREVFEGLYPLARKVEELIEAKTRLKCELRRVEDELADLRATYGRTKKGVE